MQERHIAKATECAEYAEEEKTRAGSSQQIQEKEKHIAEATECTEYAEEEKTGADSSQGEKTSKVIRSTGAGCRAAPAEGARLNG